MIRINQVKLKVNHNKQELLKKICSMLNRPANEISQYTIVKQSIDARKKPELYFSYVIDVQLKNTNKEENLMRTCKNNNISLIKETIYQFPMPGEKNMRHQPVIIGMGPAGLFCGYYLAKHGFKPIILERGKDVTLRTKDVELFWKTGKLELNSNVQFGEGGAGTFSDGKLNTLIKDKSGRNKEILKTFIQFGAPESILYDAKPHIGTDLLIEIVKAMREEIISLGGEVHFESQVIDFIIENHIIKGVKTIQEKVFYTEDVILAIGHSARDTFELLYNIDTKMEAKSFAVGFRVEHPQALINESQYGTCEHEILGAAPYKLASKASNGRGVYSFCMCPGGYVVNASSEENHTVVNGMSYSKRNANNANSAIIVSVSPDDFKSTHPLSGIAFQRELEKKAFQLGNGRIPVQYYGDFKNKNQEKTVQSDFYPCTKGEYTFTNLTGILPHFCEEAFIEGMEQFGKVIKGFSQDDTIILGVESRTSSPIRILRDDSLESNIKGLYPCGEGAGYAGGITSAAMDGLRIAEVLRQKYTI